MTLRTVTLSPGLDHRVHVDHIDPGAVGGILSWTVVAGGKGVNVARVAHRFGLASVAYSLVGQHDEQEVVARMQEAGPRAVAVAVPGTTRRNLTLTVDSFDGPASHAMGPRLSTARDQDAERLLAQLLEDVEPGDVVSFNGAVPYPIRASIWAEAAVEAHALGAVVIADAQGDALVSLVRSGVVTMAKPNEEEARILNRDQAGPRPVEPDVEPMTPARELAATTAIRAMLDQGVATPVVSLGAHGVVCGGDGGMTQVWCEIARPEVHVGAGDAFVAGYCVGMFASRWEGASPVDVGVAVAAGHVAGLTDDEHVAAVTDLLAAVRRRSLPGGGAT